MTQEQWIQQKRAPFSIRARLRSFVFAWNGILHFFKKEHNAQLHLASTLVTGGLNIYCNVNSTEAIFLLFAIGLVWVTEMINTAIEKTMDFITLERKEPVRQIKDMAAGAVLVASMIALVTGSIIFIPKFLAL